MDRNPISTADYAASDARDAQMGVSDCIVLIGWLAQRVTELEALVHPEGQHALPTLPSMMRGFGYGLRQAEAVKQARANIVTGALVIDTTPEWQPLYDAEVGIASFHPDYVDWMQYEFRFSYAGRETTRIGRLSDLSPYFKPDLNWMFRTIPDGQHES